MSRWRITVFFIIVLTVALLPNGNVFADERQLADVEVVNTGTPNKPAGTAVSQTREHPTGSEAPPPPPPPPKFGGKAEMPNFKYTNLEKENTFIRNVNMLLAPGERVQKKIVEPENNHAITVSKVKQCVSYSSGTVEPKDVTTTDGNIRTKNLPIIGLVNSSFRVFASMYSLYSITPSKTGIFNMGWPDQEVVAPPDGCSPDVTAEDVKRLETQIVKNPGILEIITVLFEWFNRWANNANQAITSQELWPHAGQLSCNTVGCHDDIKELADVGDSKDKTATLKGGGFVNIFHTQLNGPVDQGKTNGENKNQLCVNGNCMDYTTRDTYTSSDIQAIKTMKCSVLPGTKMAEAGLIASDCRPSISPTPTPGCGSDTLPDLSTNGSCSTLCNTDQLVSSGNYLTAFEKGGLTQGDLPDLAKQIINKAGEVYKVPPAMILSMMVSEGSFEHPSDWVWTDENVKAWSICGGKMPKCEQFAHPATGSRGAVGWIPYWFYEESDKSYAGVQAVDKTRTKNLVDPCNFMDAIFALAKSMQKTSGGTTYPYTDCWGHPLLMNGGPSTTCAWGEDRITTATRQYAGYCTEPGKNGSYPPETKTNNHFDRAINFFKAFTCGG